MGTYKQAIVLWRGYGIQTAADLDRCLDSFRILFAYHSGRIENEEITYHDTRDIFENGRVHQFTGNPRTLFEQQNQKQCYEFLKEKIVQKQPLSLGLVLDVHRILTEGTYDERRYIENGERPGAFKRHDYVTGVHEVGAAAEDVETQLTELLEELEAFQGKEILKAAAYFHARFEYIHPFADGNGRTGRTLLNLFLMLHDHPPLIIYDEDKGLYYGCLQKYDEAEDLKPLTEFLHYETEKTWAKALELSSGGGPQRKGLADFTPEL